MQAKLIKLINNNNEIEQCIKGSASKDNKGIEGLKKGFLFDECLNYGRQKLHDHLESVDSCKYDGKSDSSIDSTIDKK